MIPWQKITNSQTASQPKRPNFSSFTGGIVCLVNCSSGSPQTTRAIGSSIDGRPRTIADAYPLEISMDCLTNAGRFDTACPANNQKRRKDATMVETTVARPLRKTSKGMSAATKRKQVNLVQAARPAAKAISIRTGLFQRNATPEGIVPKKSRTGIRSEGSAKTAIAAAQNQRAIAERIQDTPSIAIPADAAIASTSLPNTCHG